MNRIIVCKPDTFLIRRITHCPTCDKRRRFIGADALWYGTTWTCCACGDSWCDGERAARPFKRGWRTEATKAARDKWEQAGPYDEPKFQNWLKKQLGDA